ncbi:gamma-glutamyl-gamma-aminobutyrate hydrolase family protein [Caenispirillum bisanense]|uniref:gamma-glutamyl-gamma-aminobutyrate hydrolase family protein n=1 Tax=Caenispirillum bisanense TaxID=414052 RepID=UPI0031D3C78D
MGAGMSGGGRRRPIIGVTASKRGGRAMWLANRIAIGIAGGKARRITADDGPEALRQVDGLLLGGGDDIGAEIYGGELTLDVRIDPERDHLEQQALDEAFRRRLPVLGVCRGSQMINVHCGGTLHQEIRKVYHEAPYMRTILPKKWVEVEIGSRLARLLGRRRLRVNSLHHQSVDRPGQGLTVVARDDHGIVQGIEREADPLLVGVQWHPEFLFYAQSQSGLLRALVGQAGGS